MKKIVSIVMLTLMCALKAMAQDSRPYTEIPVLDKFVGEWVCLSKGKSLKLFLVKDKTYVKPINSYVDALVGYYEYKQDRSSTLGERDKNRIIAGRLVEVGGDAATFLVTDPKKNKTGRATLDLMPDSPTQAKFDIGELEGLRSRKRKPAPLDFRCRPV